MSLSVAVWIQPLKALIMFTTFLLLLPYTWYIGRSRLIVAASPFVTLHPAYMYSIRYSCFMLTGCSNRGHTCTLQCGTSDSFTMNACTSANKVLCQHLRENIQQTTTLLDNYTVDIYLSTKLAADEASNLGFTIWICQSTISVRSFQLPLKSVSLQCSAIIIPIEAQTMHKA